MFHPHTVIPALVLLWDRGSVFPQAEKRQVSCSLCKNFSHKAAVLNIPTTLGGYSLSISGKEGVLDAETQSREDI